MSGHDNDQPDQLGSPKNRRASIIEAVKTPLGFFALVLLIVEAVFGLLAAWVQGVDRTLAITGMIAILVIVIAIVTRLATRHPEALSGRREEKMQDPPPSLAPLETKIAHLEFENKELHKQLDDLTSLRTRIIGHLGGGESLDLPSLLFRLKVSPGTSLGNAVESLLGILVQQGKIVPDRNRSPGYYRLAETL